MSGLWRGSRRGLCSCWLPLRVAVLQWHFAFHCGERWDQLQRQRSTTTTTPEPPLRNQHVHSPRSLLRFHEIRQLDQPVREASDPASPRGARLDNHPSVHLKLLRAPSTPPRPQAATRTSNKPLAMASAIFFLDLKGKTLLARNYRGDIPMSAVEQFPVLLSEAEEESSAVPPCFSHEGINVRLPLSTAACSLATLTDRARRSISTSGTITSTSSP